MSTATALLFPLIGTTTTGVSSEANWISRDASELASYVEESAALFGDQASLLSQLWSLGEECGEDDWDGDGALALDNAAISTAVSFIRALPTDLPLPELAPEPDGAVSLDWIISKTRMFSVSCGLSPRLVYSWLDGTDRGHAVAGFDGWAIPERIQQGIRSITGDSHAPLRFA